MSIVFDINKSIKENGFIKTIFLFLLIMCMGVGIEKTGQILLNIRNTNYQEINNVLTNNIVPAAPNQAASAANVSHTGTIAGSIDTTFNNKEWIINRRFHAVDDGYYCVRDSSNFDSAIIYYKNKVAVGKSVNIRFQLRKYEHADSIAPKLILAYGEEPTYRLFFPDTDPSFVGFEDASDKSIKNQNNRLILPFNDQRDAVIELTTSSAPPNRAILKYKFTYFPSQPNQEQSPGQIVSEDSFLSNFPWTNPADNSAAQLIGVGAFNNTCLKVISFSVL